jgi:hypothetical protein
MLKKMMIASVPALLVGAALASAPAAHAGLFIPVQGSDVVVLTSGDDVAVNVTAQFTAALPGGFSFFGTNQTVLFMNSNGNLTFGIGSTQFTNDPFPTGAPPRIAPFWDDLFLPPGQLRVNSSTPGVFNAIWNMVDTFGPSNTITVEATLLGAGNPFGAAAGTIVLSYGQVTGTNDGSVTVGLNQGNGVGFATLSSLGIGGTNGILNTAQAQGLPNAAGGGIFTFTPSGTGYIVTAGAPTVIPEPASVVLLGLGAVSTFGYGIRRRKKAA